MTDFCRRRFYAPRRETRRDTGGAPAGAALDETAAARRMTEARVSSAAGMILECRRSLIRAHLVGDPRDDVVQTLKPRSSRHSGDSLRRSAFKRMPSRGNSTQRRQPAPLPAPQRRPHNFGRSPAIARRPRRLGAQPVTGSARDFASPASLRRRRGEASTGETVDLPARPFALSKARPTATKSMAPFSGRSALSNRTWTRRGLKRGPAARSVRRIRRHRLSISRWISARDISS